jgi:hypothetical protein
MSLFDIEQKLRKMDSDLYIIATNKLVDGEYLSYFIVGSYIDACMDMSVYGSYADNLKRLKNSNKFINPYVEQLFYHHLDLINKQ